MKKLKPLSPTLPDDQPTQELNLFMGNISGSPKYVTDGHLLMLRSAIRAMLAGEIKENAEIGGNRPTEARILTVWNKPKECKQVPAQFIGCATIVRSWPIFRENEQELITVAVFRDSGSRLLLVNAYLLRLMITCLCPDSFSMDASVRSFENPLVLLCGDAQVGILMPMRYYGSDLNEYELDSEPITL